MPDKPSDVFRKLLDSIVVPDVPAPTAAQGAEAEREEADDLDQERRKTALEADQQKIDEAKQDQEQRKEYAKKIYLLIVWWLVGILMVTILSGLHGWHGIVRGKFHLSDQVILGLIGGTTINVLGIFLIVVRNLFPRRDTQADR